MCKYIYSLLIAFVCMQLVGKAQTCPTTATLEGLPSVLCTQDGVVRADIEVQTNSTAPITVDWSFMPIGAGVEVYDHGHTFKSNNTTESKYASLLFKNPTYAQVTITANVKCVGGASLLITKTLNIHKAPLIKEVTMNDCLACQQPQKAKVELKYDIANTGNLYVYKRDDVGGQPILIKAVPSGNNQTTTLENLPNGDYRVAIADGATGCYSNSRFFSVRLGDDKKFQIVPSYTTDFFGYKLANSFNNEYAQQNLCEYEFHNASQQKIQLKNKKNSTSNFVLQSTEGVSFDFVRDRFNNGIVFLARGEGTMYDNHSNPKTIASMAVGVMQHSRIIWHIEFPPLLHYNYPLIHNSDNNLLYDESGNLHLIFTNVSQNTIPYHGLDILPFHGVRIILDKDGNILKKHIISISYFDGDYDVISYDIDEKGFLYVVRDDLRNIRKIDQNGTVIWSRHYGGMDNIPAQNIEKSLYKSYVVATQHGSVVWLGGLPNSTPKKIYLDGQEEIEINDIEFGTYGHTYASMILFDPPKISLLPPAESQICQGKTGELKIKYQCLANPKTETYAVRIAKPGESYYVLPAYAIASTESEVTLNFTIPSSLEQGTYNVQVITMNQAVNTEWLENAITVTPDLNKIVNNDHVLATNNGTEVAQICENETIQLSSRYYYVGAEYVWQLPKNIGVISGQISATFYQTLGEDNDNFVYYVSKDNTPFSVVFGNNALGWHILKLTVRNKCGSFSNTPSLVVYSVRGPFEIKGPQAVCVTNEKIKYEILTTEANRPNTHWQQYSWGIYIVNGGVEQQIPFTSDINANQTRKNGGVLFDFKKIIDSYTLMTTGTINWNQVLIRLKVQAHAPGCVGSVSLPEEGSFDVVLYNSPTPTLSSIPTSCKLKNDGILNISFAEYAGQNIRYWVYNDVDDSNLVYEGTALEQQISNLPTGKYIVYATFGAMIKECTGCNALPENRGFGGGGKDFCYSTTEIIIENGTPRFEVGCTSLVECGGSSTNATIKGSVSFPGHINPLYSGFQGFYYRIFNHLGQEIQVGVLDLQPTDDFTIQVDAKEDGGITPNKPYKLIIGAYSAVPDCDVCTMNNIYCPHEFDIVFQTPKVDIAFENSAWMNMRDTYFKCPNATTSIKVKVEAHAPPTECPTNLTLPYPDSYMSLPLEYKVVLRDAYNKPIDATPNSGFQPANTLVNDISNLSSGKYIIIVRPIAYTTCIFTKTFDVIELSPVTVTAVSQNANCNNGAGKITLLASGFSQHMEYVWEEAPLGSTNFINTNYNTAELTNLGSGQYRYTIRYKDGAPGVSHCSKVAQDIVTINKDEASITNVAINNGVSQLACQNTVSNLPANITATNATRGKTFIIEWLKEQTIPNTNTTQMVVIHTEEAMQPLEGNFVVFLPANLASEGKYTVNVKDPTGCPTKSATITLTKPVSVARNFTICVRWETEKGPAKEDDAPVGVLGINPADAIFALQSQVASCLDQQRTKLEDLARKCFDPEYLKDRVVVAYKQHMEHCTLYYYDRAGQLTKTIPPKGVDLINPTAGSTPEEQMNNMRLRVNSHTMATTYTYNSLGQLVKQYSPDGGTVHFVHDELGRIRFSQDDRHKANNTYSYTKYDELGRSTEVGVRNIRADGANTPVFDGRILPANDALAYNQPNTQPFPQETGSGSNENNTEETKTVYSIPADVHYLNDPSKPQRYLLNRVSYAYTENIASLDNQANQQNKVYNYYSYDVHGNVEWLAIDVPGLERKFVSYKYDLISGKVHMVKYNEGKPDQFYHKYEYDADNRILAVYTSTNGVLWDKDAKYEYYQHGPLKRIELGENKVQGVDYIYTIQGWIKGINSPIANTSNTAPRYVSVVTDGDANNDSPKPSYEQEDADGMADIGGDGKEGSEFAADQFGMAIGYYEGDYKSTDEKGNPSIFNAESGFLMPMHRQLFNGNISTWATHTNRKEATGNQYNYDRLHRITRSNFLKWANYEDKGHWGALKDQQGNDMPDAFRTTYKYDRNGNIMHSDPRTPTCNGFLPAMTRYDNMGREMDRLTYKYASYNAPKDQLRDDVGNFITPDSDTKTSNRLKEVTDEVVDSRYTQDLERTRQYEYDAIGNITRIRFGYYDTRTIDMKYPCGIFVTTNETRIKWTAYNKPSEVTNTRNGKVVRYLYDAMGNRVLKFTEEIGDASKRALTYHVRDAQGNVLSTYEAGKKKTIYQDMDNKYFTFEFDANGMLTKVIESEEDVTNRFFDNYWTLKEGDVKRILFVDGKIFLCVASKDNAQPKSVSDCMFSMELTETTTIDNTLRQTEVPIYGSDRIGMYTPRVGIDDQPEIVSEAEGVKHYSRARGAKRYELKDHLGNIRVTVSDRKIAVTNKDIITYHAEVLTYTDYYPFGMAMPTRNYQSPEIGEHRYGFNGKENDADFGDGIQDYGFRIYDELVCRFLSVDPLMKNYPELTPYQFASNRPIDGIDLDGLEHKTHVVQEGEYPIHITTEHGISLYRLRQFNPRRFQSLKESGYDTEQEYWEKGKGKAWNIDPGQHIIIYTGPDPHYTETILHPPVSPGKVTGISEEEHTKIINEFHRKDPNKKNALEGMHTNTFYTGSGSTGWIIGPAVAETGGTIVTDPYTGNKGKTDDVTTGVAVPAIGPTYTWSAGIVTTTGFVDNGANPGGVLAGKTKNNTLSVGPLSFTYGVSRDNDGNKLYDQYTIGVSLPSSLGFPVSTSRTETTSQEIKKNLPNKKPGE
jgi:RHS repeat-associated protein